MSDPNYLLHDGEAGPSAAPAAPHGDSMCPPEWSWQGGGGRAAESHTAAHASRDSGPVAEMVETTCTETAAGRVRHLLVELPDGTFFRAPVKIMPARSSFGAMALPRPMTHRDGYVYALPGGGEVRA